MNTSIQVGIMSAPEIDFNLHGLYKCSHTPDEASGKQYVAYRDGLVFDTFLEKGFTEMYFYPQNTYSYFELQRVTIGINFHWERTESQNFRGVLKVIVDGDQLTVINIIDPEEYLKSVISSEMSATASSEFLKVHAVISRSWLLAQITKHDKLPGAKPASYTHTDEEWIQWFDREDHDLFDVCADDHCQRYQGITRIVSPAVQEAVEATGGMVLMYDDEICDARFYKCCGGATETFENTWEQQPYPYLVKVSDCRHPQDIDLTDETQVRQWILDPPQAFCNTNDSDILGQVLNNYDQETHHFYRWKVVYTQEELSRLIADQSGIDFGQIIDLIPLQRGVSGRIIRLRIEGSNRTITVGKELLIRRLLSTSHLYSSAFVVDKRLGNDSIPQAFTLHGAGWGHGVGLCQIGAAVMCAEGYTWKQVLEHYYPGSSVGKWQPV